MDTLGTQHRRSLRTEDIQYEAISGEVTNGTVKPVCGERQPALQWPGYALLADEQEVGKHQDSCEQGQYENMSREEAIQGSLPD